MTAAIIRQTEVTLGPLVPGPYSLGPFWAIPPWPPTRAPLGPPTLGSPPGPSLGLLVPPLGLPVPCSLGPWSQGPGAAKTNDSSQKNQ